MTDELGTAIGVELDRIAAEAPDDAAVICGDEVVTRGDLASRSNRLARHLAALGVRQGSIVTIALPNTPRFFETVFAVWKLGAIPQPASYRLPPAELAAVIDVADPAAVVGLDPGDGRPWLPVDFDPPAALADDPLPPAIPPAWKAPTSSGSTGRPKLVVSGQPGTAQAVIGSGRLLSMRRGDRFLCTAPLYHGAPFMFSLVALAQGNVVVLMPRFDALDALRLVQAHRITWMYLVPTMMQRIVRLGDETRLGFDVSTVRVAYHVGAPCPPHVKRTWIDWLGPDAILELYAGVEGQAVTFITGREWLDHPGSVGRVISGEMRVLDEDGTPLDPNEIGEIWMRPPPGLTTYHYRGATARSRDGWESLGDMGYFDADDYLYLADRRTDMILVGGANVYPAEIEAVLDEHPAVLSSCVIGLPDDDLGNRVHAIVQTNAEVSDDDLESHVAGRLVPYKRPRTYEHTDDYLRDDTGKVRRGALRQARLTPRDAEKVQ